MGRRGLASGAAPAAIRDRVAGGRQITAGGRHDALRDLARTLVGLGFTGEPLYLAVLDWNAAHCDPPKAASDVRKAIGEVEAKFEMDPPPIRLRAPRADLRWRK